MLLRLPQLDETSSSADHPQVHEDDLFFVSRNGSIWACWLSGKPAVNLGSEAEARSAMRQFLGTAQGAIRGPSAVASPAPGQRPVPPPSPPPAPTPAVRPRPSVWDSAEPRYIEPPAAPKPTPSRTLKERAAERHDLTIIGRIFTARGSRDVTILDLSETGCQFHETGGQLKPDDHLTVKLGPVGPVEATVRWKREERVGVQFKTALYPAVLDHIRGHFDLRRR